MPRAKRGPGTTHEDPPSKRGGRTATRGSSVSGEGVRPHDEDDPVLRNALGLPPGRFDATANIAMMGTASDDEDGHWGTDFEPEEHRRPRVTEPSTPLDTGHEEADFGAARPQEEGLGFSPIRDTARVRAGSVPPGFPPRSALTALEAVDRASPGPGQGEATVCSSATASKVSKDVRRGRVLPHGYRGGG